MDKKLFGLIGFPLGHSFSKKYFTEKFEKDKLTHCEYQNFPIENIEKLPGLIQSLPELAGLNVTIPYKESVIQYLDHVDKVADKIGAVNTIKVIRSGDKFTLNGYNTDSYGFFHSLEPHLKNFHQSALIIGTGGSSKAVAFVLDQLGIDYLFVSRNPKMKNHISYFDLCGPVLNNYQIIINTSPIGMYPNDQEKPDIPYDFVTSKHILFDLIYNPPKTNFLKTGEMKKATIINGLNMLHLQAEKSWQIWNEKT